MILLDTSALYALADAGDSNHGAARRILAEIEGEGEEFLVHTYILLETFALLHRRHGLAAAVKVSRETAALPTIAVDRALHDQAVDLLRRQKTSAPSLVETPRSWSCEVKA